MALIALVVLGPKRLPEAMRTLGLMVGRMRRAYLSARAEIEREIGMDEVRRELHNESIMRDLESPIADVKSDIRKLDNEIRQDVDTSLAKRDRKDRKQPSRAAADSDKPSGQGDDKAARSAPDAR